jgi:hypothetical protein
LQGGICVQRRPSLDIEKAFVAFVRGQSDEAGFETVSQPGFQHLNGYVEFWLRFIGVREVVTLTLEHTWDDRAVDMVDAGKKRPPNWQSNSDLIKVSLGRPRSCLTP